MKYCFHYYCSVTLYYFGKCHQESRKLSRDPSSRKAYLFDTEKCKQLLLVYKSREDGRSRHELHHRDPPTLQCRRRVFLFFLPSSRLVADRSIDQPIQEERPHHRRTRHHRHHLYSMRVASVNNVIAAPSRRREFICRANNRAIKAKLEVIYSVSADSKTRTLRATCAICTRVRVDLGVS